MWSDHYIGYVKYCRSRYLVICTIYIENNIVGEHFNVLAYAI